MFVEVPGDMAAEANRRFPFLWRTEYQLRAAEEGRGYSSDKDPDYEPGKEDKMEEEDSQDSQEEEDKIEEGMRKLEKGEPIDEPMMVSVMNSFFFLTKKSHFPTLKSINLV